MAELLGRGTGVAPCDSGVLNSKLLLFYAVQPRRLQMKWPVCEQLVAGCMTGGSVTSWLSQEPLGTGNLRWVCGEAQTLRDKSMCMAATSFQ